METKQEQVLVTPVNGVMLSREELLINDLVLRVEELELLNGRLLSRLQKKDEQIDRLLTLLEEAQ